jgi:hypothetical protein
MRENLLSDDVTGLSSTVHLVLRSAALVAFTALAVLVASQNAMAQNYPERPIRVLIPSSPR